MVTDIPSSVPEHFSYAKIWKASQIAVESQSEHDKNKEN